ncbi:transglycosylase domain-containing protein [Abiotrophia defectiva]|uniref:transglycosylase domain-containing protein n=1 Tax=Abiotrophia defectiva TaxID=46125 RepID=UPI0028CFDABC|nr:transglycosylase domain-containing protein [Abiotrophia defectiva]
MTLDDDKKKVSEQSDQHYYDVSFDIAPDKEDSRGHSTPPSNEATSKPSRWDNFYEDYSRRQAQARQANAESNDQASTSTSKGQLESSQTPDSTSSQGQQDQDSWHYQPKSDEKTVMAQSSEFIDRSVKRVRDFFSNFNPSMDEANPYKQANPVSDQDFQSHLFQEETEKDPVSPAKEKAKKKKVVKPTESKAKPELVRPSEPSPETSSSSESSDKGPRRRRLFSGMTSRDNHDQNPEEEASTDLGLAGPVDMPDLSAESSASSKPASRVYQPRIELDQDSVASQPLPSPADIQKERERRRNLDFEQARAKQTQEKSLLESDSAEKEEARVYQPLDADLLRPSSDQPKEDQVGEVKSPAPTQSVTNSNDYKSELKPSNTSQAADSLESSQDQEEGPHLSSRGRARLSSLLSIFDDITPIEVPNQPSATEDANQGQEAGHLEQGTTDSSHQEADVTSTDKSEIETDPELVAVPSSHPDELNHLNQEVENLSLEPTSSQAEFETRANLDQESNHEATSQVDSQENLIPEALEQSAVEPSLAEEQSEQPGSEHSDSDSRLDDYDLAWTAKTSKLASLDPDYFDQAHTNETESDLSHDVEEEAQSQYSETESDDQASAALDLAAAGLGASQDSERKRRKTKGKGKGKAKAKVIDLSNYTAREKIFLGLNVAVNVVRRIALYIVLIGLLLGSLAAGAGAGYFAHLVSDTKVPNREEMAAKINKLEQQSTIYYANGTPIANVQADVIRSVTSLSDISPNIVNGLVSTEDSSFYEHKGVVPKAILRATLQEVLSPGSGTGGSTLTQQLVKQRLLTNDVTFFRKANEILLALRLEQFFSKDEILTAYLNVSPFGRDHNGDNVAGIEKASEGIFGKKPSEVNLAQAAFLVGLPQDPYNYTPYQQNGELKTDLSAGIERMKDVLYFMYRNHKISEADYQAALNYDIKADFLPAGSPSVTRQSYLYRAMERGAIEQIMRLNIERDKLTWTQVYQDDNWYNQYYKEAEKQLKTGGYKVYTTIDQQIYDLLQESAKKHINDLGMAYEGVYTDPETGQETSYVEKVQNGMVVMDNNSGKVLGFIAGTDFENNQIDHAFGIRRSPGSTIKPLAVYGPAIQENLINPSTVIPDTEFTQTFEDGTTWSPTNYGNVVSGGAESARVALYKSDNLPAVRVYQEMQKRSVDVMGYLEKMGFNPAASYTPEDVKNLAFAIGGVSSGPTVLEETRAFATFANNGNYHDGYFIDRIEDAAGNVVFQHQSNPTQVFSEDSNYLMIDMLRNTMTEGTGRIAKGYMSMGGDWIAKSGISENSKDVWFIASTPSITIGSWIGYDSRFQNYTINIDDGYGRESERSQRYWANVVNELYAARPDIFGVDRKFSRPSSVQETDVLQQTGTKPGTMRLDNGGTISITGPTYKDLFKVSHPAPELNYKFLFGATDEELANFWSTYRAQLEEQRRQEDQRRQQESSSSSSSSSSSAANENPGNGNETPGGNNNNNNQNNNQNNTPGQR